MALLLEESTTVALELTGEFASLSVQGGDQNAQVDRGNGIEELSGGCMCRKGLGEDSAKIDVIAPDGTGWEITLTRCP